MDKTITVTVAVLALVATPVGLRAQFSSDRPGLGDGTHVLPAGAWQIEAGAQMAGNGGVDAFRVGQALVRVGTGGVELRFFANSLVFLRGGGETTSGREDFAVGAKVALQREGAWTWSLGGSVTLPTGSDAFSSDDPAASIALLGETSLSDAAALAVNVGYASLFDDLGDGTFSVLVTPSFSIADVEGLSLYTGYAGFFGPGEADAHYLEAGMAKLLGANAQWDINAGYDVDNEVWFVGLGVSKRWP